MERLRPPIGVLGLLLVLAAGVLGQAAEAPFGADLRPGEPIPEATFAARLEHHQVPGASVAVIHAGQIDWAKGYGVRRAGEAGAVDESTLFQAASISKPVAAAGALRLVADGVLSLDGDVNERLESWKLPANELTAGNPITLRQLLSHTSGLIPSGFFGYDAHAELPTLVEILDGEKPAVSPPIRVKFEPGKLQYSGGGYTVIQQLMADAASEEFPDLMKRLVLGPAGMTGSLYGLPLPEDRRSSAAAGHLWHGKLVGGSWRTHPELAAAGLWTTPTDLAKFAIEVWRSYHGRPDALLPRAIAREMLTRQAGESGLGFFLPGEGVARFHHGGANVGYRCFLVLSIESGDGIAVMTNGDSGQRVIDEVIGAVAKAYGWS